MRRPGWPRPIAPGVQREAAPEAERHEDCETARAAGEEPDGALADGRRAAQVPQQQSTTTTASDHVAVPAGGERGENLPR
jgi:hypothetical protein